MRRRGWGHKETIILMGEVVEAVNGGALGFSGWRRSREVGRELDRETVDSSNGGFWPFWAVLT